MTRTDVHSPTNLVTEDYEFAYCYDAHPEEGDQSATWPILHTLMAEGYRFEEVHGGDTCDHCGARLRYVAVLKHLPTTTLIKVGETCLDNRFSLATAEFHALRRAAKLNRERRVLAEVRGAFQRDHQDVIDFLDSKVEEATDKFGYTPDPEWQDCGYLGFYLSLQAQLLSKGLLSERQVEAVRRGMVKAKEFEARKTEESKTLRPVETGRIVIEGEVQSVKTKDSQYGPTLKMLVLDDRGFKVWGTVPRALNPQRGDRVRIRATVTQSDKDESFGFFSRPQVLDKPAESQ